jgi:hypothetical protein
MCSLGTELTSDWLMVDPWEAHQSQYQPTAVVLDHFDHEVNEVLGGIETSDGRRVNPAPYYQLISPLIWPKVTVNASKSCSSQVRTS